MTLILGWHAELRVQADSSAASLSLSARFRRAAAPGLAGSAQLSLPVAARVLDPLLVTASRGRGAGTTEPGPFTNRLAPPSRLRWCRAAEICG